MYTFAIIGCGRIAQRHAESIVTIGRLAAVCDADADRAAAFACRYGARAYGSMEELLQREPAIDVVSICTPNGYHAEQSIKALEGGKHVLCEKPLCLTSASARQVMEAENKSGKKLFVVKSARYNPLLQDLKRLLEQGLLGSVYSFQLNCFWNRPIAYFGDWHGRLFPDGGTLFTQFSHYIDTLYWLFGDLAEARGFSDNKAHGHAIEFEDTGVAALRMTSGVLGTLNWSVNTFKKNAEISLAVLAEKGTVCLGGEYLNEVKYLQLQTPHSFPSLPAPHDPAFKSAMSHHKEIYTDLLDALRDAQHSLTNSFTGLKTVEIIEKIYASVSSPLSRTA